MPTTPLSLLDRLRQPEAGEAWPRFVELYTPLLVHWARRLGLPDADVGDLVQEVFVLLLKKIPHFEHNHRQSFRAYLHTVLVNKWRDQMRRRHLIPSAVGAGALDNLQVPDPVEEITDKEYKQQLVSQALHLMRREFQSNTWRACWNHVVAGRTARSVADELGITVNAVYLATSRVMRRLRSELTGLLE